MTKPAQRRYYLRNKDNPDFRRRVAANKRRRYHERDKFNPEFMELQRERGRRRYHEQVKTDPVKVQRFRELAKKNTRSYRERKQAVKLELQAYLGGECKGCGITDSRLLDFDHIDPMTKLMNISTKLHLPWDVLIEEANKCQLLCPNCHRLKTLEQAGNNSYVRKTREYRNPRKKNMTPP